MEITEVRVFPVNEEKLRAYATITFDDCFVVRDLKVIHGNSGLFVAMPSKKRKDGSFKDIAHPLNNDFRAKIEQTVLDAYEAEVPLEEAQSETPPVASDEPITSKTPEQIKPEDYAAPDDWFSESLFQNTRVLLWERLFFLKILEALASFRTSQTIQ